MQKESKIAICKPFLSCILALLGKKYVPPYENANAYNSLIVVNF